MDVWQGDQRRELLQELERREPNARGAVGPRMRESIDEIAVGVCLEAFQGHGTAGRIADEAFQLIAPVRRNLGMGVYRKPLHAGTVGACQHGRLACAAQARAEAPDPLTGPLPKGDALLHGGRQGTGKLGCVLSQGIIPRGHGGVATRFEVAQMAELTDDTMADFLHDGCHVGIAGRLALEKAGLEALVGAIEIDPLEEDTMKMEMEIEGTPKPLHKRDRPWLNLVSWDTACDRLVHIILPAGRADDRMDLRGQL